MSQYFDVVNKVRNKMIRCNIKAFADGELKDGTGKKTIRPRIGDLVLVKNSDNARTGTYGVLQHLEESGLAIIRTKKGDIRRATNQLIPLAGECLLDPDRNKNA